MKEVDFSKGKRGAVVPQGGKTRVTLWLDNDVLAEFRHRSEERGHGYQTEINAVLREYLGRSARPLDEETLRRVLREELAERGAEGY